MPKPKKSPSYYSSSEEESSGYDRSDSDKYDSSYSSSRSPSPPKKPAKKKARSGWHVFCSEKRPGIRKKHPSWPMTDVTKELGSMWRGMSDRQKEKYNKKARK